MDCHTSGFVLKTYNRKRHLRRTRLHGLAKCHPIRSGRHLWLGVTEVNELARLNCQSPAARCLLGNESAVVDDNVRNPMPVNVGRKHQPSSPANHHLTSRPTLACVVRGKPAALYGCNEAPPWQQAISAGLNGSTPEECIVGS